MSENIQIRMRRMLLALCLVLGLVPLMGMRTEAQTKLAAPTGLKMHISALDGNISWNAVEGADAYMAWVYKDGRMVAEEWYSETNSLSIHGLVAAYGTDGNWTFAVQAIRSTGTDVYNSDVATMEGITYAKLAMPTGVVWDGYKAKWNAVPGADAYTVKISGAAGVDVVLYNITDTKVDLEPFMKGWGDESYCFSVSAVNKDDTKCSSLYAYAEEWKSYTGSTSELTEKLKTPTNLHWDGYTAKWDAVENAVFYTVVVMHNGEYVDGAIIYKDTSFDCTDLILWKGSGDYTFEVTAKYVGGDSEYNSDCAESKPQNMDGKVYSITVTNGSASNGYGYKVTSMGKDTTIKVKAKAAPRGQEFDKWVAVSGNVMFADANAAETTFKMPAGAVEIKATYKGIHVHKGILVPAKQATLSADGSKAYYTCDCGKYYEDSACIREITGNINAWKRIAYPKKVTLSKTDYTYDKRVKKPTVKVVGSDGREIPSTNYTVSYAKGRRNIGTYKVTVTFKGKYTGRKSVSFKINPKGVSIGKLLSGKKSFTVKWKALAKKMPEKRIRGYQVQYAASSKFVNAKTKKITGYEKNVVRISKLKAGKKYYVRIRTYIKVSGKTYYSNWSKAKTIKTKK